MTDSRGNGTVNLKIHVSIESVVLSIMAQLPKQVAHNN